MLRSLDCPCVFFFFAVCQQELGEGRFIFMMPFSPTLLSINRNIDAVQLLLLYQILMVLDVWLVIFLECAVLGLRRVHFFFALDCSR